jgi:hypothetical protein
MKTFKTPKGTVLPVMDMRGKDYLQVAQRIVWFREDRPEWRIETEFVALDDQACIAKAIIRNDTGAIMATAHKREDRQHFADFMEKAETGAIGRAVALCGFGTQFCGDEIDEGARIVDTPQAKPAVRSLPVKQIKSVVQSPITTSVRPNASQVGAAKPEASSAWEEFNKKNGDAL